MRLALAQEPEAHGDTGAIKQLAREGDDAFHQVGFDDGPTDITFSTRLRREGTVGKHQPDLARGRKVMDHVLHPGKVGIARWRDTEFPAHIVQEAVLSPLVEVERWVRHDEIGLQGRVLVVEERVGIRAEIAFKTTDSKVHVTHFPCVRVGFLSVNGDIMEFLLVVLDELDALHEHTARTASGVVDASTVRLQNLHNGTHDTRRGVKFARILAFHRSKFHQAIFVGTPQEVFFITGTQHLDVGKEVHHIAQTALVEFLSGIILGQNSLQPRIVVLDFAHGIVDYLPDFGGMSRFGNHFPTGGRRHEEHVFGHVFVLVFFVGIFIFQEFLILCFKFVGDVFQENQSQYNSLIFSRIEVSTEGIGGFPYLLFKAK